jgi:hypothetical protein
MDALQTTLTGHWNAKFNQIIFSNCFYTHARELYNDLKRQFTALVGNTRAMASQQI